MPRNEPAIVAFPTDSVPYCRERMMILKPCRPTYDLAAWPRSLSDTPGFTMSITAHITWKLTA